MMLAVGGRRRSTTTGDPKCCGIVHLQAQAYVNVWLQNYLWKQGARAWRDNNNVPPPAHFISSPHDIDAHYAKKRSTSWIGYKLHIIESCDDDAPPLITHVETLTGPTTNGVALTPPHAAFERKDLLPQMQVVDTGYMDSKLSVTSRQQYGVELWQCLVRAVQGLQRYGYLHLHH
jgi:hypothetical protein